MGIYIPSLAIPVFASTSSSLGFEGDFTRIIREEFISHAKVPLVQEDEAAVVLCGEVHDIKTEPLSYSLVQNTVRGESTNYEVTNTRWLRVTLNARLLDRGSGKIIWEDKAMEEKAVFSVGTDPLANRCSQRKAVQEIANILAKKIYLKTMERF
ncbi:MAG: LPS assembly lipoprotein LptE [Thermodesulfobacteriota bacterium]|nr:LPS assembly lipoprotein LptE [Thermodesulfobacteriota bacterium]